MHRGAGFGWYDRPSLENTAILLWETGGCRVGGIRGVIASASLKPRQSGKEQDNKNQYPRRYCLGLIEASQVPSVSIPRSSCIRGVIASASLKPVPGKGVLRKVPRIRGVIASASLKPTTAYRSRARRRRIRGVIASASLKLLPARAASAPAPWYPRRYCLGLIEAGRELRYHGVTVTVSEAVLPRPH